MRRSATLLLLALTCILSPFTALCSSCAQPQGSGTAVQVDSHNPSLDKQLEQCREQLEAQKRVSKKYATMLILCCVLSIALTVFLSWLHWLYNAKLKTETDERVSQLLYDSETYLSRIDRQKQQIEHLNKAIENSLSEQNNLRQHSESLFKNHWSIVNKLCSDFFEAGSSAKLKEITLNRIEAEISSMKQPENMQAIVKSVNENMSDILNRLHQQCPFLTDADIMFLGFFYAGFAPKTICLLFDMKLPNLYARRLRLKKRILNSDAPDRQMFVDKIH